VLSDAQVLGLLVDAGPGLSAGAVAEQAGVGYSRVLGQLRALETRGEVRRVGNRRTTRWRVVTDEERIAQRAAELERLARRDDHTQRRGRARVS
jgi:sugar-specific transcriptional regulator TrmB